MTGESWHLEASYTVGPCGEPHRRRSTPQNPYRMRSTASSPCGAGYRCAPCPAGLADVRSTFAGSPNAAAVTVIAISLRGGALPCLLPGDLAFGSGLAEEAPEDAHALAIVPWRGKRTRSEKVRLTVWRGLRGAAAGWTARARGPTAASVE
jgi:hypothetical protein